jgi:hypothetical protein
LFFGGFKGHAGESRMLRLIQVSNQLPVSFPVDYTATFQAGQIAQLKVMGNEVVCGVSDGTAPFGIIDDINTSAFTAPVTDRVVTILTVGIYMGDGYYSAIESMATIHPNVVRSSFVADVEGLLLNDENGLVIAPAGTKLNYDSDGDGIVDSIRTVVNYVYRIANIPGDSTITGSGRMTVWFGRGIYETDQFDTRQRYVVNATLFVNGEGLLTTEQLTPSHVGIGMVSGPPSGITPTLELIWF